VFLSEARNLVSRFNSLDHRLDEIGADVNAKITAAAAEITSLGTNIADVNRQILASGVPAGGAPPPDLLDQRDRLLARLSELVEVHTVAQSDGTMGVFIGSGQVLVLGTQSAELDVTQSASSPEELDVVLRGNGPDVTITRFLSGGALGGALDFRREMLAPARAGLGRIAAGLATTANALHRNGMDFNGALGADLFSVPPPEALAADANAGTGTVAVALADLGGLEATRYELTYDGAGYTLTRTDTGAAVPLTGSGTALDPLQADGLSMVVAGAPVAGDRFLIRTVDQVPSGLALMLADPAAVAAAAPTLTRAALANTGAAQISAGTVIDATDPNLLATATIEFLDPATYSIDGAGAFAYTAGADIDVNGTRVRITGVPAAGDQFTIEANTGGIGDNRNALALLDGLASGVLDGGAVTLQGAVAQLVTRVGVQTAETNNRRDAQALVLDQTRTALDSVRGINLDEEAGDMLRYEQAYQAAAKTIAVADGLFSSLLNALRGG
jgi:flagellar hook-associated protein 1 FlgK